MGLMALALAAVLLPAALAETFKLTNGQELSGKVVSADSGGLVIQKADGSFVRTQWGKFSQEALKELSKRKDAQKYAEQYLEPEEEPEEKEAVPEIKFNPPTRLPRPDPKTGFGSLFSSSVGILFALLLYGANVYSAYEIALFRNYHWALVCGLSLVMPVITQIVFLCVPTRMKTVEEIAAAEAPAEMEAPVYQVPGQEVPQDQAAVTPAPGAPAHPPAQVYQRGQTTFNRRFFETKLAGFLKVVPGEAEKDMVVEVSSLRGNHVSTRIARIMPNEIAVLVHKGTASEEVIIPFTEIREVRVRHKDA